jgi:serine/threonine-protein phosphatase 2A regulatory subunit A
MVSRLATNEWFTARISSAALIATAYTRLKEEDQKEFLSNYCSLCRDDTPMVRRVASQYLGQMLETVIQVSGRTCLQKYGTVTTLFIPLYEELASNDQPDSVRLQTTGNCVAFGRGIGQVIQDGTYQESEIALVNRVLPLIVATIDDRSWRVRWTAASKFAQVICAFDPVPNAMDSLVPAYEKLLQDPEAEVCL